MCVGSAELYLFEACLYALEWDCVCFSVDYRKAPEVKAPRMQLDFCEAVEYVYDNAHKFDVDNQKLAVGGFSGGAQLVMSAMYHLSKRPSFEKINIKFQFLISPLADRTDCRTPENELDYWEKKYKNTEFYMLDLLTNEDIKS